MKHLIRSALTRWHGWRARRQLARSIPDFDRLHHAELTARKMHRPTAAIMRAKREAVTELLKMECGRNGEA